MDYYEIGGTWWFPDSPDNKVSGKLTFDADGLNLIVYGSLVPTRAAPGEVVEQDGLPDWEVTPFIHGRTYDMKRVTLLHAGGANLIGPSVSQSSYRPRLALTNVHVQADRFVEVWCGFDCLTAWAEPPAMAEETEPIRRFDLRFDNVDLCGVDVGDVQVRLLGARTGHIAAHKISVEQEAMFAIQAGIGRAPPRGLSSCARFLRVRVEQHVDRGEPATQSAHASWDTSCRPPGPVCPGKRVADHAEPEGFGSRAAPRHGLAAPNSLAA
jgi:hypothetical protein